MDSSTIMALAVAAVVTPWLTEVLKTLLPGDFSGKKALTMTMIISVLISAGVLWYEGKLTWTDPTQLFASAGLVLGIATAVYQYLRKAVQGSVNKMLQ